MHLAAGRRVARIRHQTFQRSRRGYSLPAAAPDPESYCAYLKGMKGDVSLYKIEPQGLGIHLFKVASPSL